AVDSIGSQLADLKRLFDANPTQKQRLEQIEPLVQEELQIMSMVVQNHRRESRIDDHLQDFSRLDQITSRIAGIAVQMEADENRLMADREKLAEEAARRTRIIMIIGIALAIGIASLTKVVLGWHFKARQKSEQLVEQLQQKARVDGRLSQMTNL